jgi:hypothetical protein
VGYFVRSYIGARQYRERVCFRLAGFVMCGHVSAETDSG